MSRIFLVIDVGANLCPDGLLAANYGCEALLFDPQPTCKERILQAIHDNSLSKNAFLIAHPVGDHHGTLTVSLETRCAGVFPEAESYDFRTPISISLSNLIVSLASDKRSCG